MATGDARPPCGINHGPLPLPAERCPVEVNVTIALPQHFALPGSADPFGLKLRSASFDEGLM